MIDIICGTKCNGCHACFSACPKQCIRMERNKEGFLYPVIDTERCVNCNVCKNVCPVLNEKELSGAETTAFAVVYQSEKIRESSSSGGVFTFLAEMILRRGGVVFGAAFSDDRHSVMHTSVDTIEELYKLRGSKYLQSNIGNSYKEAEAYLKSGREVLFSGTPCQIEGLYAYLKKEYPSLYTVDLICHGVPSPMVWDMYLKSKEKELGDSVSDVNFRSKQTGWKLYSTKMQFSNGNEYASVFRDDLYMKGFLQNLYLRSSCYECKFKGLHRRSDITLGDFWGLDKILPCMDDDKGTSLVIVQTQKGRALFDPACDELKVIEVDALSSVARNGAALQSSAKNPKRKKFFDKLQEENVLNLIERYTRKNKWTIIKSRIYRYARRLLKK